MPEFHGCIVLDLCRNICDEILVKKGCWKLKLDGCKFSIKNNSGNLKILTCFLLQYIWYLICVSNIMHCRCMPQKSLIRIVLYLNNREEWKN